MNLQTGRNELCPCGSGKKYKHCCQRKDLAAQKTAQRVVAPQQPPVVPIRPRIADKTSDMELADNGLVDEDEGSPADDATQAAQNRLWDAFEAADYEEKFAICRQAIDERLLDGELTFEFFNQIFDLTAQKGERHRFEALVDLLEAQLPEAYAEEAYWLLDWRMINLFVQTPPPANLTEQLLQRGLAMADAHRLSIDPFIQTLDRLAYYGHLDVLIPVMTAALPKIATTDIFEWALDEYKHRLGTYLIFAFVEQHKAVGSGAFTDEQFEALVTQLTPYMDVIPEGLKDFLAALTGAMQGRWTPADFNLKRVKERRGNEDDDPARTNLARLLDEFLAYLRWQEQIPFSQGTLARDALERYILERHAGELQPTHEAPKARPGKRRKGAPSPVEPPLLCPDHGTLDRYWGSLMHFFAPQHYKVAAMLALIPAWLRFLEARGLIDADQSAQSYRSVNGLVTELAQIWRKGTPTPAFLHSLASWQQA